MSRLERMGLEAETIERLPPEAEEICLKWLDNYRSGLIAAAASARERGVSWRPEPFKIGCSLLALGEDQDLANPQLYTSANYKPKRGAEHDWPERKCGEMSTIFEALGERCRFISAIVTVSSEKSTLEHGTEFHDVVHPCQRCRELFVELIGRGVMSPQTRVLNIRDDGKGRIINSEERTVQDILDLYSDVNHPAV